MELFLSLGFAMVSGFICATIFDRKDLKPRTGFWLGFLLPAIGIVVALLWKPSDQVIAQEKLSSGMYKECPECAEVVRSSAKTCRFCQTRLPEVTAVPQQHPSPPLTCSRCGSTNVPDGEPCNACETELTVANEALTLARHSGMERKAVSVGVVVLLAFAITTLMRIL